MKCNQASDNFFEKTRGRLYNANMCLSSLIFLSLNIHKKYALFSFPLFFQYAGCIYASMELTPWVIAAKCKLCKSWSAVSACSTALLSFSSTGCSLVVTGVLLAVAIGVAMGVVIGGIMLCLLTMYMKRYVISVQLNDITLPLYRLYN